MTNKIKYIGGEYASHELLKFFNSNASFYFPDKINNKYLAYYETATDAIAAIICNCCEFEKKIKIWIPEIYCFETIERLKLKLIKQNITVLEIITYNDINKIKPDSFSCVILNHYNIYKPFHTYYFGSNTFTIEDYVQAPFDITLFKADYAINSLRKFCNLEVAVAYQNINTNNQSNIASSYLTHKKEAEAIKTKFFETGDKSLEIQYLELYSKANQSLFNDSITIANVNETNRLSKINFLEIIEIRRRNFMYLKNLLDEIKQINVLPGNYMYLMIECHLRNELKTFLQKRGVFTAIHWLDSDSELVKNRLSFHIDHRYDYSDMKRVSMAIKEFYGI